MSRPINKSCEIKNDIKKYFTTKTDILFDTPLEYIKKGKYNKMNVKLEIIGRPMKIIYTLIQNGWLKATNISVANINSDNMDINVEGLLYE